MPPIFFLNNYYYNYNNIYSYHGYIFYKVHTVFPQSFLHYEHTFCAIARDAVCRFRKFLC